MNDFKSINCQQSVLDPQKRVQYTRGLVLGVDEFRQEQTHFLERDRLHNRSLHGYGTVYGLSVRVDIGDEPEVVVEPGMAIDPSGQHICVPSPQCAKLNDWLKKNADGVQQQIGSPPNQLSLYVVLCYRECGTDQVPIPGGPCRLQDDTMAASRVAEDFELKLEFEPPPQIENETARQFGQLLARIVITDEPGDILTKERMISLVKALVPQPDTDVASFPEASPPDAGSPPDFGSPPETGRLHLHPDQADEVLDAALKVWVTEVRPKLWGAGPCGAAPRDERCVLLAELRFDVDENIRVGQNGSLPNGIDVNNDNRPTLLSTRMLQEWLTFRQFGSLDHGSLAGLGDDDHPQYLKKDDPASGDLDRTYRSPAVRGLQRRPVSEKDPDNGNVLTWNAAEEQWQPQKPPSGGDGGGPPTGPAGGDLTGMYPDPFVRRLQKRPVSQQAPNADDVLTWNEETKQWEPRAGGGASGSFVQAPALDYAIVAAGFFDNNGNPRGPVYNAGFRVIPDTNSRTYLLRFPGYRMPTGELMYIVKGTIQREEEGQTRRAVLNMIRFDQNGIIVQVLAISDRPNMDYSFMVEISAYGKIEELLQEIRTANG